MRLLLALGCAVLALVAWLLFAPRHEREMPARADETSAVASVEQDGALVEVPTGVSRAPAAEAIATDLDQPPPAASASVIGRAVDDSGAPLPGASVTLTVSGTEDHDVAPTTVHTGADGRFVFELPSVIPSDARVTLSLSATDSHAQLSRTIPDADEHDARAWTAGANDLGDFVLQRCGALRGRVVDAQGQAIDLAFIELYPATSGRRTGTTAAQGAFRVSELPPDSYKIGLRASGWMTRTTDSIVVRLGETTTVPDIVLAASPTIRGVVVDETGAGVPGMRVEGRAPLAGETVSATTKSGGAFALLLAAEEATTIRVRGWAYEFESAGGEGAFAPGTADVRLVLKRHPRMQFFVVDEKRAPIERFAITLSRIRSSSDTSNQGWFGGVISTLDDRPRGEWSTPLRGANTVEVRAPKHAPRRLAVVADAGQKDVQTIQLERAATIAGRVRLDGEPLGSCSVSIAVERSGLRQPEPDIESAESLVTEHTMRANLDGEFEFDELCAGSYTLEFSGGGASSRMLSGIAVVRGQAANVGDVDLMRAASVRGTILTRSGESPQGFRVKLDWREASEITEADGHFAFTGLAVGPHRVVWSRPGESEPVFDPTRRTVDFELASGEERELVIDARDSASCTLTVRVTRNGRPASGIAIHAGYSANARAHSSSKLGETDADGAATAVLDAGRALTLFVLDAESHVLGGSGRAIDLVPGGRVEETIRLETGTVVVELPAGLVPVTDGRVTLWFPNFEQMSTAACARGSAWQCKREWSSTTVDFGEFAAGSYDVTVGVERWLPLEKVMRDRPASFSEPLREPHTCRIEIRSGAVTRIVVP